MREDNTIEIRFPSVARALNYFSADIRKALIELGSVFGNIHAPVKITIEIMTGEEDD